MSIRKNTLLLAISTLLVGCDIDVKSSSTTYALELHKSMVCFEAKMKLNVENKYQSESTGSRNLEEGSLKDMGSEGCNKLTSVFERVAPSHALLIKGVIFPKKVYLFNINDSDDQEIPVGFFNAIEECNNTRTELVEIGYKPNECYERTMFWTHIWT